MSGFNDMSNADAARVIDRKVALHAAKMNAEKAQANVGPCQVPLPYGGQLQGQTQAFGLRESASYRIERALENARSDRDKFARALDILKRHPEFEELIELLNMHLI